MTLPEFAAAFLAFTTAYYAFFVTRVRVGWLRLSAQSRTEHQPSTTVIIAARDEAASIERCLDAVRSQRYLHDKLEVIVVDDGSTDDTASIVRRVASADPRVRLVELAPRADVRLGRKPEAIALGVEAASGEIILTTDADCIPPPSWVRTMTAHFDDDTALVAGPVALSDAGTFFARFEAVDFLGILVSGAGLIGAGRPIICNGANLAYRASSYRAAQDLRQASSNDDGTLMSRIATRSLGAIRFAASPSAVVRTDGTRSITGLFRQRRRWAAVRGRFLDPTIYLELSLLFLFFVSFVGTGLLAFLYPPLALPFGIVAVGKAGMDYTAVRAGARRLGLAVPLPEFVAAELVHAPFILAAVIATILMPFRWKGRTLRR